MKIWLPAIQTGSGTDVFTLRLAYALQQRGHDAIVQFFGHHHEPCPALLHRVQPPAGIDLIHGNSWSAHAFARPGIPLLVTEHHYIEDPAFLPLRTPLQRAYHSMLISPQVRRSYGRADAITAVSSHTASAMQSNGIGKVPVIHNWVDLEQFAPQPDNQVRRAGPIRGLFVGNPSRRKGSDLLPTLAAAVGPDVELLCLGGLRENAPSSTDTLRRLPRRAASAMPALYSSVDMLVVPTRYEAFGYAALEAMACGLPVVGFASTGTEEVCEAGTTALLSAVDDVPALVANIRRLAEDPGLRAQLGRAGRIRATSQFNEDTALQKYLQAYQQLIDARG